MILVEGVIVKGNMFKNVVVLFVIGLVNILINVFFGNIYVGELLIMDILRNF